jgi:outer membrane receptor protein involved in Fe transport
LPALPSPSVSCSDIAFPLVQQVRETLSTTGGQVNGPDRPASVMPYSHTDVQDRAEFVRRIRLRAACQLDKHWRATLSVNNIFDRVYFQTVALPSAGDWYGEPRNYRLRLDATF